MRGDIENAALILGAFMVLAGFFIDVEVNVYVDGQKIEARAE